LLTTTLALFFRHPPSSQFFTLSLHDALPISDGRADGLHDHRFADLRHLSHNLPIGNLGDTTVCRAASIVNRRGVRGHLEGPEGPDRKSTRLNSSHVAISYAVFCLKKKKKKKN